jgi:hypothetical protein
LDEGVLERVATIRLATVVFLVALVAALLAEVPGLAGVVNRIEHIRPAWIRCTPRQR